MMSALSGSTRDAALGEEPDPDLLWRLYRTMLYVRLVEEEIVALYPEQEMRCPVHLSIGQEAAAAGVAAALRHGDQALSGHRSHGHYLAMDGDLDAMFAEIYGKASGCAGGRGGSMHLIDRAKGFLGAVPIVGSTIPIAAGAAYTNLLSGNGKIAVAFFGDGAAETGVFHETLNFAALKKLPLLFVCENNLYSVYSPMNVRQPPGRAIADLARAHGIATWEGDGNDAVAVWRMAGAAVARCRSGQGPAFLELATYRWREHCGPNFDNDLGYRTIEEYEAWRARCPIERHRALLVDHLGASDAAFAAIEQELQARIDAAVAKAKTASFPAATLSPDDCYADDAQTSTKGSAETRRMTFAQGLVEAQSIALEQDPNVYLMGLGAPDPKGIFGTTAGLVERFGPERVQDMPLSENAMTGAAVGMAITGMRPILTHQRVDFALLAMEQMVNEAAKWFFMTGGQVSVPLTIRMTIGRGWGQGPQHSQSLQAWFAHVPGLKVIMPATPADAKGLLLAAIEDDNPVICLEHRWLYGISDEVPVRPYRVPLGKARLMRRTETNADITLVGLSYMSLEALRAAELLARQGVEAEVIDLRSVRPLDEETILESVARSGRLVVADTAHVKFGAGAEVVSLVVEQAFDKLKAAPVRVGLPDYPTPTSKALSDSYYPRAPHIAAAALRLLGRPVDPGLFAVPDDRHLDQPDSRFTGPF